MADKADLFGRAALVARDPERFEMLSELHDDEKESLVYERGHKWNGPVMMWYTVALCAVGAATQGWDQTGSNGANLSFPDDFGLKPKEIARDDWIVGIINAIIFLTAGLMCVHRHRYSVSCPRPGLLTRDTVAPGSSTR